MCAHGAGCWCLAHLLAAPSIKLLEQFIVDAVHIIFAEEGDQVSLEGYDVVFIDAASFASIECGLLRSAKARSDM